MCKIDHQALSYATHLQWGRYVQKFSKKSSLSVKRMFGFRRMVMYIRYSASWKISIFDRKIKFSIFSAIKYQRQQLKI